MKVYFLIFFVWNVWKFLSSDQLPFNRCVFFKGTITSNFSNELHGVDMAKKSTWLKSCLFWFLPSVEEVGKQFYRWQNEMVKRTC